MSKYRARIWTIRFDEISKLGSGGNADVYLVKEKASGKQYALKELRTRKREKVSRFKSEIKIMKENYPSIPGIIPVRGYSCKDCWYTMPLASPVMDFINEKNLEEIVNGVIQLCETLELLHNKGIHHRDIKPSNIYYYNQRFSLGDFGLVDFPNSNDFTRSDRGLGAIFTIAPEMKRNPKMADASKADVFSIAKTFWMFLSGDEKGFDGVYDYLDKSHSLRYVSRFKKEHLVEIEELLKEATSNDPNLRPDIHMFKERLLRWKEINNDFDKSQSSEWNFLTKQLFGKNVPESSVWRDKKQIIDILNIMGQTTAYNHMMLPGGGGIDFLYAEEAKEDNCIYLYDDIGCCRVVQPESLQYEGFSEDCRWSYFRMDLKKLSPIIDNEKMEEFLVEDVPGHYVDASCVQYGVYDYDSGKPLPKGYKTVKRHLEGCFLFVLKGGPYNQISATYDGRHGMVRSNQFRKYIEDLIKIYRKLLDMILSDEDFNELSRREIDDRIWGLSEFDKNPFNIADEHQKEKETINRQELINKNYKFIRENYKQWNFSNIFRMSREYPEKPICFFFEFTESSITSMDDLINNKKKYICTDGFIREIADKDFVECIFVRNREEAIEILENIKKVVEDYLKREGLSLDYDYNRYFSISFRRYGTPTHLFEKSEIETAMRNANDQYNNQLVVDEDGYIKIISNDEDGTLYPVRLESWDAGNNYVGKFSDLCTLDENYKSCLDGWLSYLTTGQKQYIDYIVDDIEESVVISKIKEFYRQ